MLRRPRSPPFSPTTPPSAQDPAGIGPEISLKASRDPRVRRLCEPVLVESSLSPKQIKIGKVAAAHGRAALEAAEIAIRIIRSEEHTSELQSPDHLVCRLLLE